MTVQTETSRVSYTGSGTTGPFTIPFYFLANADIRVVKQTISTGAETELTLTTDYSLTGAGVAAGGELTLVSSLSSSFKLVIFRDPEILQDTAYPRNDPFPAESHEEAIDLLTMIAQRQSDLLGRAVRLSEGDVSGASMVVPAKVSRASKTLGFDANGAVTVYDPESAVDTADNITFLQAGTGAVSRTATSKMREVVSVTDFGAVGDSTSAGVGTDDTTAFTNAIAACQSGARLFIPDGSYKISSTLTLSDGFEAEFDANARLIYTGAANTACLQGGVSGSRYSNLRLTRPSIILVDDESYGIKLLNPCYFKIHDLYIEGVPEGSNIGIWMAATTGVDGAWNHLSGTTRVNHCAKGLYSPVASTPYDGFLAQLVTDYFVYYGDYASGYTTSIAVDMAAGSNSIFHSGYIEYCGKGFVHSGLMTNAIRVNNMVFDHCHEIVNLSADVTGQTQNFRMTNSFVDTGWEAYTDSTTGGTNYLDFIQPLPVPYGLKFPATQVASSDANTLDDYEEGTWTPSLGGTASISANGRYRKIGGMCTVWGYIDAVTSIGTGSTTAISGLPFNSANTGIRYAGSVDYFAGLAVNVLHIGCYVQNSASTMRFTNLNAAGAAVSDAPAIFGNGAAVYFQATYPTAS